MNLKTIKEYCKNGYLGIIPGWIGYIKWNYADNTLIFINGDYIMS